MTSTPSERIWKEAILWWSFAAFQLGMLFGIGIMFLGEWLG